MNNNFPTDPMRQHDRFIDALCSDWLESGIVSLNTEHTPRANAVLEISRQLREGDCAPRTVATREPSRVSPSRPSGRVSTIARESGK